MTAEPISAEPISAEHAIRSLNAETALRRVDELVAVLRDSIKGGASMNFLAHVTNDELADFWRSSIDEQKRGRRILLVAEDDARIVGTALLIFSQNQNSPHRAEVGKMIVHRDVRRHGLAARLLTAIEQIALANGRTLLLLDTETDSPGELLYRSAGWTSFGVVPDHALTPDGMPKPTTFFYKHLNGTTAQERP